MSTHNMLTYNNLLTLLKIKRTFKVSYNSRVFFLSIFMTSIVVGRPHASNVRPYNMSNWWRALSFQLSLYEMPIT
jgi:hypothetical protein